jgi:uncharacterized protein YqeY
VLSAVEMKARMRGDLMGALKEKRADEIAVLRSLLAAIDNAEAPPIDTAPAFGTSAEVERLLLTEAQLRQVLRREMEEREQAAEELARLGQRERADALLRQSEIAGRYFTQDAGTTG